jgi:hypothetical protein
MHNESSRHDSSREEEEMGREEERGRERAKMWCMLGNDTEWERMIYNLYNQLDGTPEAVHEVIMNCCGT